jgi:hypothetical protein
MQREESAGTQKHHGIPVDVKADTVRDLPKTTELLGKEQAVQLVGKVSELMGDIPKPLVNICWALSTARLEKQANQVSGLMEEITSARSKWYPANCPPPRHEDFNPARVRPSTLILIQDLDRVTKTHPLDFEAIIEAAKPLGEKTVRKLCDEWGWFQTIVENIGRAYRGEELVVHKRLIDVNEELRDGVDFCLRYVMHRLRGKVAVNTSLDETIPPIMVNSPGGIVGNILPDLFENADKSMEQRLKAGGASYKPTITVTSKNEGNRVSFTFEDNGVGFNPADADRLFDLHYTTSTGPGSEIGGYGLWHARHLTEKEDGTIKAESNGPNTGAKFTVTLPLKNSV